jgi:CelD/BcsL family acetyltransferase involved in cellulose biosynthesis
MLAARTARLPMAGESSAALGLTTEIITDWDCWAALEPEWNDLLERSRSDTLFLTWQWIKTWATLVGPRVAPLVVLARDGRGGLAGAAPFYRTTLRFLRTVPYRALRIMGDFPTGAVYGDWIVRQDCEEGALVALAGRLARVADWDCLWMPSVAAWTGAASRLRRACEAAKFLLQERPTSFSTISLPASMDAYVAGLPYKRRKDVRRLQRNILGGPGARVVVCRDADQLPRFLEALFELHAKRWQRKGDPGAFRRKPTEARFYVSFAPVALDRGWLRLVGVEDDAGLRALEIGYVYKGTFLSLQGGFDPDYLPGVGTAARLAAVSSCIEEGVTTFDYLGEFNDDKRKFGAEERIGCQLLITRPTLKGQVLHRARVWPTGRYLRPAGPDLANP